MKRILLFGWLLFVCQASAFDWFQGGGSATNVVPPGYGGTVLTHTFLAPSTAACEVVQAGTGAVEVTTFLGRTNWPDEAAHSYELSTMMLEQGMNEMGTMTAKQFALGMTNSAAYKLATNLRTLVMPLGSNAVAAWSLSIGGTNEGVAGYTAVELDDAFFSPGITYNVGATLHRDYQLLSPMGMPIVRGWSTYCRVVTAWAIALGLFLACWADVEKYTIAGILSPQAKASGSSILGNSFGFLEAQAAAMIITVILFAFPVALSAGLVTFRSGINADPVVAAIGAAVSSAGTEASVWIGQSMAFIAMFFPWGTALTALFSYIGFKFLAQMTYVFVSTIIRHMTV